MNDKPAPAAIECQSKIDKDLVRTYYGDLDAFYRVRAALAATPAGEDGPCFYCGEQTCSVAGNPGRWPLVFCQPDGTGIVRFHHTSCVTDRLFAATPAVGREPVAWRTKNDFGHSHVTQNRALADTWIETEKFEVQPLYAAPPASPLRGREAREKEITRLATIEECAQAAASAWASNDFALRDQVIETIRALASASPPEQPAAGCGDPSCKDPDCTYGKGTNYLAQPAAEPFQPHENCDCLMCLAEKPRDEP